MRKIIMLFILICFCLSVNTQIIVEYKDPESSLFGLKDSITGSIVVKAEYKHLTPLNDTLFIAESVKYYYYHTVIDQYGNKMFDYTLSSLFKSDIYCLGDSLYVHPLKLLSCPLNYPDGTTQDSYVFYINLKNECIPTDYFPCPDWTKINLNYTPEYLKYIQRGEYYLWNNKIDSAILMCKKAIEIEPENPANYYWGANIFLRHYFFTSDMRNNKGYINSKNTTQLSQYHQWIIDCLNNAEKYESNPWVSKEIQQAKRKFYKHSYKNKSELKKAKVKIIELRKYCKNIIKLNKNNG